MNGVVLVGGPGAAVWEGQRCGYRGRSLRSEDRRTAEAALPLKQGSGRLAGRGLAGVFRREAPGFGLWGWDVWWRRGPVPEGGWYGKGQGGGFLSSERPAAEL